MAGTRLLVHVSFLFGMLSVAALAVFMALRPGPSPLLPDRSGWAEAARVGKRLERLAAMLEEEAGEGKGAGPHPLLPPLLTSGPRCAVTVAALDEDPASHAAPPPPGSASASASASAPSPGLARRHHGLLASALDAAVGAAVRPVLSELSPVTAFDLRTRTAAHGRLSEGARAGSEPPLSWTVPESAAESFWARHEAVLAPPARFGERGGGGCHVDLVVYVPSRTRTPLAVGDGGAAAFALPGGRGAVAIANLVPRAAAGGAEGEGAEEEEEGRRYAAAVLGAVDRLADYLRAEAGLGAAGGGDEVGRSQWRHKFLAALEAVRSVREAAGAARRMPVPGSAGRKLARCVRDLEAALELRRGTGGGTAGEGMAESLALINAAAVSAAELGGDGALLEWQYFPWEHFLAVLSPLILPLLLPLLIGLVREVRRFRKLKRGESQYPPVPVGEGN